MASSICTTTSALVTRLHPCSNSFSHSHSHSALFKWSSKHLFPDLRRGLNARIGNVLVRTSQRVSRNGPIGAASESPVSDTEAIKLLEETEAAVKAWEKSFLETLPGDLKSDLQFAAFQLANGPVDREISAEGATTLAQLGRALEGLDVAGAANAVAKLPGLARSLPPGSSQRLRLGRRLVSAARPLASSDQKELKRFATALLEAGNAIQKDCIEEEVPPPAPSSKVLKFGSLQLEVTAKRAYTGSLVAVVFALLSGRVAIALQGAQASNYANQNAQLASNSLQGTLLIASYFCTGVALFAAVGLVALGLQVGAEEKTIDE